jgi:hypothetical protein
MNKEPIYIQPAIIFYSSFDEALSDQQQYIRHILFKEEKWEFRDLYSFPRTFVVAEPGYGKTRLLQEIVERAHDEGKKAIFVEPKKIRGAVVEKFIQDQSKNSLTLKSDGFELKNDPNVIVCFDALDEVKPEDFSRAIEKIKAFLEEHQKITAIISCRWHFFQRYKQLFNELKFRYARIFPFSKAQVHKYLKACSIQQRDIDRIMSILSFRDRDLVIQTPRYLELLVSYIQDKGIKNIGDVTKTELFEFFIYKKLEIEDKNLNTQKCDHIKRVLEKLALIMEIYQTNLLTKDKLMSFFDDLKSDLTLSLLQQVPLEIFYNKTVLKDNIDTIEFDNTEFQEYLAAKETLRLRKNNRTIFELAVDPELREIHPSWFNMLTFVVDLDISILKPLLDFGQNRGERISQDEEYHRFLTKVDTQRLTAEERKAIFKQVFEHYQNALHWIDWDISQNLSYYFDKSQHDLLKYYADERRYRNNETKRFVCLGNVAQVVGFLLERDVFDHREKAYWRQKLIKFARDKNENGVLQRNALFALGKLKDDTVIKKVESVWQNEDKLIRDAFLEFCIGVNPNHNLSIKYFIEGTKQESIYARYGLYDVTEIESVNQLLDAFIQEAPFLESFMEKEGIFKDRDGQLIENIKAVWNQVIEAKLRVVIQKAFESKHSYHAEHSEFIRNVALLLKSKDEAYLFSLVSQIAENNNLKDRLIWFESIFSTLLKKKQVERFVNELSQFQHGKPAALRTLQRIKLSDRADAEEIYEEGRKYFSDEYAQAQEHWVKPREEVPVERRLYIKFQFRLEPEKGMYGRDVFSFYLSNKDQLKPLLKPEDKDRMKTLIEGSIFDKFDPGAQDFKIIYRGQERTSYEIHPWISIFGDCIKVARDLGFDVTKYRKKVIRYIPYAYDEDLDAIFSLVPDIQPDEVEALLSIFKKRKSDVWRFRPDTLIQASQRYVIKEAVPILREFIDLSEFSIYERINALKTSEFLHPDKGFLKSVFEQYKDGSNEQRKLAESTNQLLIENHRDKEAINWRFEELITGAFPFKEPIGTHSVSRQEHELRQKEFAAPVMRLKHPQYEKQFFDLLQESFNMLSKEGYWAYAQYLWETVYAYFDNRKEERSYSPLRNLEFFVEKHSSVEGINWFQYHIKRLKRSYMIFIGKPTSVAECIQKYNQLKSQQYLRITSPLDLYEEIKDVIEKDLKQWVESEGAYRFIVGTKIKESSRQNYEDLIQKTIKAQIENFLLKRGLKGTDIIREPQLLDGKHTDFLIFYGFIEPILIEVKLSTNPDLSMQKNLQVQPSYKNLVRYMNGFKAHFGIFLVFDTVKRTEATQTWEAHLRKIKDVYQGIKNVTVFGLKCS